MNLHFMSPRDEILGGAIPSPLCPSRICALTGHKEPHLCFTTEPLPGLGQYVYMVDIPAHLIEKYEYENEFREEKTRYFAIPLSLLKQYPVERNTFEQVTARPWNKWTVTVLDRRAVKGHGDSRGKWAVVWASRPGVASAKVYRRSDKDYLSIEVTATSDFDPEKDYLVVENHEEMDRISGPGTKETFKLVTIAGPTPQWVIFPSEWQKWVWDRQVTNSAIDYITSHAPHVKEDVRYAMQKDSKQNKARSWRIVADEVGRTLSAKLGERIDLGKLAGHSWTSVAAMPHRIANRMSQHLPYAPWVPPMPQPEYASPEESGRYALANLHGPYPTRGPGIDHAPQERPYTGREGELGKDDNSDFRSGQREPALALA